MGTTEGRATIASSAPAPQEAPQHASPRQSTGDVSALPGLTGPWRPILASPTYILGLLLMFVLTLLMPLLYVGFISAVVYGGYRFSLLVPGFFDALGDGPSGRAGALAVGLVLMLIVAVYASLLVILIALLLPVLIWGGRDERNIHLEPNDDPKLFEFVHSVCEVIGAPKPREIEVDCSVNAAAGLRGMLGAP